MGVSMRSMIIVFVGIFVMKDANIRAPMRKSS